MDACNDKYISKYIGEKVTPGKKVVILLHGRRQSPDDFFDIAQQVGILEATWILACAPGKTWYPHSFLRAIEKNQPHLDNALSYIESWPQKLSATPELSAKVFPYVIHRTQH
jgi:predicted esterase